MSAQIRLTQGQSGRVQQSATCEEPDLVRPAASSPDALHPTTREAVRHHIASHARARPRGEHRTCAASCWLLRSMSSAWLVVHLCTSSARFPVAGAAGAPAMCFSMWVGISATLRCMSSLAPVGVLAPAVHAVAQLADAHRGRGDAQDDEGEQARDDRGWRSRTGRQPHRALPASLTCGRPVLAAVACRSGTRRCPQHAGCIVPLRLSLAGPQP